MTPMDTKQHIITALVLNQSGVLARIAGLFARRGFNIESLAVSVTEDPEISRMTIVAIGDDRVLEQIVKQLSKLIDVMRVVDYADLPAVQRELALVKVGVLPEQRAEVIQLVEVFRGKIIDVSEKNMLIELTGGPEKIDAFAELMGPYGVRELARTGVIAMARGQRTA